MRTPTATLIAIIGGLCLVPTTAWTQTESGSATSGQPPQTRLACSKLQAQIEQTIRANGARHFLLAIVDDAQVADGVVRAGEPYAGAEVVGSCDGGTHKIVYSRHAATRSSAPVPDTAVGTTAAASAGTQPDGATSAGEPPDDRGRQGPDGRVRDTLTPASSP
ncbi:DUF1161 domain-containing protein [Modicisalibacter coralii]|uniref:DUF1161 domain-containing protein n=1 Tax=Modicisalibacter coralii TaxID=2304602 RepID=UPI00100C2575|nr:DUF1161 domain-containing protein [Halomonas coralii]